MTDNLFEITTEDSSLVDVPIYIINNGNYTFESYSSKKNSEILCALLNERERLKTQKKQLQQRITELEKEVNSLSNGEADWLIEEML